MKTVLCVSGRRQAVIKRHLVTPHRLHSVAVNIHIVIFISDNGGVERGRRSLADPRESERSSPISDAADDDASIK